MATASIMQVLRLMETFALAEVTHAIEECCLLLSTISFERRSPSAAVPHRARRPPRLDMDNYVRICPWHR